MPDLRCLKRWVLGAYDAAVVAVLGLVAVAAAPDVALAYIDPSVMTYAIQAVAGVVVALSAVLGVALRRVRKNLARLLDIDGTARCVQEGPVHRTDGRDATGAVVIAGETETAADEGSACASPQSSSPEKKRSFIDGRPYGPRWPQRLGLGLLTAFFLVFTVFFVAPIEIAQGSSASLVYGAGDLWPVLLLPGAGLVAALGLGLSLFRGRGFNLALAVVFALGLCAWLQALFLNGGLPAADGATIYWGDHMAMQVVSTAVWVLVAAIAVVGSLHNRRRTQGVIVLASVCLVAVQAAGLVGMVVFPSIAGSDQSDAAVSAGGKAIMTEDGLYAVSNRDNVIMFVLDTFDDAYLKRILKTDSSLLDEFTGFTRYENCTGSMIPTRFAVPQMLTGQMPRSDEAFSVYKRERYQRGDFLDALADADYSIGLYTDSLTISDLPADEQAAITGKTVNVHDLPNAMMDTEGALRSLYQMALYRDVPWSLKWAFWYYTDQINTALAKYDPQAPAEETIYVMDDVRYYERLCTLGLSARDDGRAGAFRFIHLLGSHYPFNYDENVTDLGQDNSDVFKQSRGALRIVSEYLRQLKELGLYDQATIIVTADHGYWTITEEPLEETSNPIMFVKPAQTAQQAAAPMIVSQKPVSQLDLQATVLDAMGLDYSEYVERSEYAGYSMLRDIDADRRRLYLTTDSEPDLTETQFREYLIEGNALDFDNWEQTGRTIDAQQ